MIWSPVFCSILARGMTGSLAPEVVVLDGPVPVEQPQVALVRMAAPRSAAVRMAGDWWAVTTEFYPRFFVG